MSLLTPGVSYAGMKNTGPMELLDSNLSKTLHEAVPKLVKFAQFAVAEERLGDNKGNEFEIVMSNDDPDVNMGVRTIQNAMDKLKTTQVSFGAHRFSTREFGMAIKFNVSDIQMSQFNLDGYTRDVLARDVAKVRDTLTEQEMATTPYRYIPYNDAEGACANENSYFCDQARPHEPNGNTTMKPDDDNSWSYFFGKAKGAPLPPAAEGLIIPTQHYSWGSDLIQPSYDPNYPGVGKFKREIEETTKRAYVASPLFIASSMNLPKLDGKTNPAEEGFVPGPLVIESGSRSEVPLDKIDPSLSSEKGVLKPQEYRLPKLTLAHVRNMVAFAIRLDILPYEKMRVGQTLHEGFVLIAPSAQVINLIDSLNRFNLSTEVLGKGTGGFEPASLKDMGEIPSIAGAQFKLPGLGVPVLVVVDDYATLNLYACYNQMMEKTFAVYDKTDPAFYWTTQHRTPMGAILDCRNCTYKEMVGKVTTENVDPKPARQMRAFGATELSWRVRDTGEAVNFHLRDYLRSGFGPCYLFGREPITELVNQAWSLRTQEKEDFNRLGGYGWVMRAGYKNNWTPHTTATTYGMPFFDVRTKTIYSTDAQSTDLTRHFQKDVLPFYKRNKIIKFDFPTWVDPGVKYAYDKDQEMPPPISVTVILEEKDKQQQSQYRMRR